MTVEIWQTDDDENAPWAASCGDGPYPRFLAYGFQTRNEALEALAEQIAEEYHAPVGSVLSLLKINVTEDERRSIELFEYFETLGTEVHE